MATVRAIVNGAFQDAGLYGAGETPTDDDADLALDLVKSLYRHLIVAGTFGRMNSRLVTGDYTAGENERVVNGTDADVTVTLPTEIEAEEDPGIEGVSTTDRQPKDLSIVEVAGSTADASIYDASLGAWVSVDGLTLNSAAPLGVSHRLGIQALLGVRLCTRFQVPIPPELAAEATAGRRAMAMNWHAPRQPTQAEYF